MKTVRRARTEAEVMGVAMDIEIGIGEMIVIVIETEVRGIDVTMKIVTEEIGVIETGQQCFDCLCLGNSTLPIYVSFNGVQT